MPKRFKSPEERLLEALGLDRLTEEEVKYLNWLLARPLIPMERKRELFKRRFPDSKWLVEGSGDEG